MNSLCEKMYVDRGMQTEPPRQLSRSEDVKTTNVHNAHTGQDAQDLDLATRPACIRPKAHQLGFQRPSDGSLANRRIVSLPETSPPQRIKVVGNRVVSLSDLPQLSPADISLASDYSECSASLDNSQSLSVVDVVRSRSRLRSSLSGSGFLGPCTPSPPSSPESVMIIGNDVQVPTSFHKVNTLVPEKDTDTVNVRVGSPPRPIPALHGPLSLPYARCPSGAEGTIIEGEDLSRMIWGLENEEISHGQRPRAVKAASECQNNLDQDIIPSSTTTIKSHIFQSHSNNGRSAIVFQDHPSGHPDAVKPVLFPHNDSPIILSSPSDHWNASLQSSGELYEIDLANPKGLGINWRPSMAPSDINRVNHGAHLKASAPVFIPAHQSAVDLSLRAISSNRSKSAIDLAQEYFLQNRNQDSLPTPPSSSTLWTPSLATPLLLDSPDFVDYEEESEQLHRFIYERMKQVDLNLVSDVAFSLSMDRPLHRPVSSSSMSHPLLSPDSPFFDIPMQQPKSSNIPPSAGLPTVKNQNFVSETVIPPSLESPVPKNNTRPGGVHQPRSIPFARLMQRRLSAVPEENHVPSGQRSPISPRPQTGVRRAPLGPGEAFRPYFANRNPDQSAAPSSSSPTLITGFARADTVAPILLDPPVNVVHKCKNHSGTSDDGKNKENGADGDSRMASKKKRKSNKSKKAVINKGSIRDSESTPTPQIEV
ncbi:hypothetical protein D9758_001907 [Tetrapyrgos nigripes]|uniref:Uncharacterized protein n=1 Tax=Tetrapyrgos nigripes TaxID=182062 RepID=A0A8H5GT53_9AGAR|nr:hypothetical protein D9758_001907 [Tetrapyrgos nigripes]